MFGGKYNKAIILKLSDCTMIGIKGRKLLNFMKTVIKSLAFF